MSTFGTTWGTFLAATDPTIWIAVGVVVLLLLWVAGMYNGLVRRRNTAQESWSDIDTELKRRYDLIPNLVETVKGYAAHEKAVFENVTNARANAIAAGATGSPEQRAQAENVLTGALRSVFAVAENYPQLQASQNFRDLQEQLTATEDKIAFARRFYNGNVRALNTRVEAFPSSLVAGAFRFGKADYFDAEDAAVPLTQRWMLRTSFEGRDGEEDVHIFGPFTRMSVGDPMPVEVFVKTGSRSLLSYLFKPILDRAHTSLTEE